MRLAAFPAPLTYRTTSPRGGRPDTGGEVWRYLDAFHTCFSISARTIRNSVAGQFTITDRGLRSVGTPPNATGLSRRARYRSDDATEARVVHPRAIGPTSSSGACTAQQRRVHTVAPMTIRARPRPAERPVMPSNTRSVQFVAGNSSTLSPREHRPRLQPRHAAARCPERSNADRNRRTVIASAMTPRTRTARLRTYLPAIGGSPSPPARPRRLHRARIAAP